MTASISPISRARENIANIITDARTQPYVVELLKLVLLDIDRALEEMK